MRGRTTLLALAVLATACAQPSASTTAAPEPTGASPQPTPATSPAASPSPAPSPSPSPSPSPMPTPSPSPTPEEDPVGFDQPSPTPSSPPSPAPPPSPTPAPSPSPSPSPAPGGAYGVVLAWDGIELRLPSARTELVGLHQSNHDGARDLATASSAPVPVVVLPSRDRGTGRRGAADIVVDPATALRAPVTGTVVRAGTYTLYCDLRDDFLVIEPDGRPGIEVKLLHIDGVTVGAGDRVVAGETVIAPRPTQLPFSSQVDDVSGPADWPHVHLEVVDTAIPDRPNPNSGSDDC